MQPTEPTRGTREFLRLHEKHMDELRQFTKSARKGSLKRKAAIARASQRTATDKQREQGRGQA